LEKEDPGDFPSYYFAPAHCDACIHNIVYFPNHYTPITNVGFAKKVQVALPVRLHRDEWLVQGNSWYNNGFVYRKFDSVLWKDRQLLILFLHLILHLLGMKAIL